MTRPDQEIRYPESVGEAFDVYLDNFGDRRPRVEALSRALAYAEGAGLAREDRAWALIARAVDVDEADFARRSASRSSRRRSRHSCSRMPPT